LPAAPTFPPAEDEIFTEAGVPEAMWSAGLIHPSMVKASSEYIVPADEASYGSCLANQSKLCHVCVDEQNGLAQGRWPDSWCAAGTSTIDTGGDEWIEVDFEGGDGANGTVATITALLIQGRYPGSRWGNVAKMKVGYQRGDNTWEEYSDWEYATVDGEELIHGAENQLVEGAWERTFDEPLEGSRFRIFVKEYRHWPSLAFDFIGSIGSKSLIEAKRKNEIHLAGAATAAATAAEAEATESTAAGARNLARREWVYPNRR